MEKQYTFNFSNRNEPKGFLGFVVRWLIMAVAAFVTAYLLSSGVKVNGFANAMLVAALIAIFNATLWPLLIFISLPAIIFTLGLFILVLNAFIILLVDWVLKDFSVDGFWWALLFSLLMNFIAGILKRLIISKPVSS